MTHAPTNILDLLPELIRQSVVEVAIATQAPIPMIVAAALAAAATSTQHRFDVEIKPGFVRPLTLYLLTVAAPGERKSAVQRTIFQPFHELQHIFNERVKQSQSEHEAKLAVWELKKRNLEAMYKRATRKEHPTDELVEKYGRLISEKPTVEPVRKLIYVDTTIQALIAGLANNGRSAALVNDEFGQFINGPMASHLPQINSIWDGSVTVTDRKTEGSSTLVDPRLTILFQTQPSVLEQFLKKRWDEVRGNGWMARFLITLTYSTQGGRIESGSNISPIALEKFKERVYTLVNRTGEPQVLRFSPDAQLAWQGWANAFEQNIQPGGSYANAPDFASKAAEQVARMAGVLHAFTEDENLEISQATVNAAGNIIHWYGQQYVQLINQRSTEIDIEQDAMDLDLWIRSQLLRRGWQYMDVPTLLQYGPNRLRTKNKLDLVLEYLQMTGRIRVFLQGRKRCIFPVYAAYI